MTNHQTNSEVFEKLRAIVHGHGMLEVLNTLPSFFEAAHETHNLNTLEDLLNARDSYWKGYQQYHDSREKPNDACPNCNDETYGCPDCGGNTPARIDEQINWMTEAIKNREQEENDTLYAENTTSEYKLHPKYTKDYIINDEVYLTSGETVSLEDYADRVTDPLLKKIESLEEELLGLKGNLIAEESETRALNEKLEEANHCWKERTDRLDWLEERMAPENAGKSFVIELCDDYRDRFQKITDEFGE